MIYVLASSSFIEGDLNRHETILKIGYCRDDREKKRTELYLTENPTLQKLFTIPGGTEQDEKNLHHHFRKYLKYGNEWFSYNPEILEFFKIHTTKKSLWELEEHLSQAKQLKRQKEKQSNFLKNKQKYINPILHSLGNIEIIDYIEKQEELVKIMNSLPEEKIDSYFKSSYSSINFDNEEIIIDEVKKILEELDQYKQFSDKMKYLYSLHMDEDIAKQVLDNIYDTRFSKYYWTISASRAGTLHYRPGSLEEEYQSIINPKDTSAIENEVKDKVFQTFQVDSRYAKSDIKETLRSIYESLNYNKTPKASDLENYFEIKLCKALGSSGKQENGFKIMKIKD